MPKKQQKKQVVKKSPEGKQISLALCYLTSDDRNALERVKTMAEGLLYQWYLGTFRGEINRVYAQVEEVTFMKEKGIPEYVQYVKDVKAVGMKYAIDFALDLKADQRGLDESEL